VDTGFILVVKWPDHDVYHYLHLPSSEVEMSGVILLLPLYAFMIWTATTLPLIARLGFGVNCAELP
jgi:hypothetical protein